MGGTHELEFEAVLWPDGHAARALTSVGRILPNEEHFKGEVDRLILVLQELWPDDPWGEDA